MKRAFKAQTLPALVASGFILLAGVFTPAHAHDELIKVTPAQSSQLQTAPTEIVMEFSGNIMAVDGANQVRVVDAEGHSLADGAPQIQGNTLTQKITQDKSANDTYTVTWRIVSSDGHPVQDSFTYQVGQGAAASPNQTESASASNSIAKASSGLSTPLKIVIFGLTTLLVLGALVVVLAKRRRSSQD